MVTKALLHSTPDAWKPQHDYRSADINELEPRPQFVCVSGRIVNIQHQRVSGKVPYAAKRFQILLIRDDTGILKVGLVYVKLWFSKVDYHLRLGQETTVWTTLITSIDYGWGGLAARSQPDGRATTIFPERDRNCYLMAHTDNDDGTRFRIPLGYCDGKELACMMTLKAFIEGGHEVPEAKVLICVKSIGGRRKKSTETDHALDYVNLIVFDHTADATLSLRGATTESPMPWRTSETILLLHNPLFDIKGNRPILSIGSDTYVDVDPCMSDAEWLRKLACRVLSKEAITIPFPGDGMAQHTML
ncbi:MAG: hypothetical protein Q9220_005652 [cf. Caloplaca sp. 1 TL-2023]